MAVAEPKLAHHFSDSQQQHASAAFGMWLFLLTEIMLFGGLFTCYVVYRYLYPASFAAASHHLDLWLGTANTAILILSSLTMVLAHHASQQRQAPGRTVALWLLATVLLGSVFLGIKAVEYRSKFVDHLVPGPSFEWKETTGEASRETARPPSASSPVSAGALSAAQPDVGAIEIFFSLYFVMTGLHAAHMVIGLGVLLVLIASAWRGRVTATVVEMAGLYWHFVDIVWIFLFPLLYLIGRHA